MNRSPDLARPIRSLPEQERIDPLRPDVRAAIIPEALRTIFHFGREEKRVIFARLSDTGADDRTLFDAITLDWLTTTRQEYYFTYTLRGGAEPTARIDLPDGTHINLSRSNLCKIARLILQIRYPAITEAVDEGLFEFASDKNQEQEHE